MGGHEHGLGTESEHHVNSYRYREIKGLKT